MKKFENDVWVFMCPEHGEENGMFCFRAMDKTLADNWKKVHVISTIVETTLHERQAYQKGFTERMDG